MLIMRADAKNNKIKDIKKLYPRIVILVFTFCLILSCASFLSANVKIKGKVKLADNPPSGHGGVHVQVGKISTTTYNDGTFQLNATYFCTHYIEVYFKKERYKDTIISLFLSGEKTDSVIDLGEIVLTALGPSFFDNFNDGNADDWIEDDEARYRVENGEYSIESPDDEYQHWALRKFLPPGNFLLQAKAKYVSGRTNEPFGIGVFDSTNTRTCLFISKMGYYELCYYDPQTGWHDIKDWTLSSVIDTISGRWNTLEMEKTGTSLKISINSTLLGSFSANSIGPVRYAGLYVQGNLHIHFDDVKAESK